MREADEPDKSHSSLVDSPRSPDEPIPSPADGVEGRESAVSSSESEAKAGSASAARRSRARDIYDRPRAYYAEMYGCTVRGVNKWIERGMAAGEPPPLGDPERMVAWWGKHMKHRVPDNLYEAARKQAPPPTGEVPTTAVPSKVDSDLFDHPSMTATARPVEHVLDTGFAATLRRVREEEAKAHERYLAALGEVPRDEGKARVAQRNWQDLSDHLRSLEKAAPEVMRRSGELWPATDIIRELSEVHAAIVNGVRTLWRRVRMKMVGQPVEAQERIWNEEVDRLFGRLRESRFGVYE